MHNNLIDSDYWTLVNADPRDWSREQKILFWWIVTLLGKVSAGGMIAAPDPAPLTDQQIIDVYKAVLPNDSDERAYMDKTWRYQDQIIMFPSAEGSLVSVVHGAIDVKPDAVSARPHA